MGSWTSPRGSKKKPKSKDKSKDKKNKNNKPEEDESEDDSDSGDEKDEKDKSKGAGKPEKDKSDKGDDEDKDDSGSGKDKDKSDKDKSDKGDQDGEEGDESDDKSDGEPDDSDGDAGDDESDQEGDKDGDENKPSDAKPDGDKKDKPQDADGDKASTGKDAKKPVDPGPPPDADTQARLEERLCEFNDPRAEKIAYVTLPTPNLKNIIVGYDVVHEGIRKHDFSGSRYEYWNTPKTPKRSTKDTFIKAEAAFKEFRDSNLPKVNYIYQQFEMRKQAERYLKTKQHKTGMLDTLRLHSYKTEDDLFKSVQVSRTGKNHGLVFVVDWSGSMSGIMAGTLEQLIVLCLFCKKASIPFDVYSLTTGGREAFSHNPMNLKFADNFKMRCYLSSSMSPKEFQDACVNLFALMPDGVFQGGPTADNLIGCTPLVESVVASIPIIKNFKARTGAEIVNAIFLTDGDANTVSSYYNEHGSPLNMSGTKFIIDDRETHKTYQFSSQTIMPTVFKILRDRENIHVVGFYINGYWNGFFSDLDDAKTKELDRQFKEDGYVISTEWGYNELYITNSSNTFRLLEKSITPTKAKSGTEAYMKEIQDNFVKQNVLMAKERIMLERFVKMIA